MVGRSRKETQGKGKPRKGRKLMGNHQRCWIWGKHAVLETLRAGRWPVLELYCSSELKAEQQSELESLAEIQGVAIQENSPKRLTQLSGSREHQGYLARMPPFPYLSVEELLNETEEFPDNWSGVLLDGIQDPYNFGAILRSAEVFNINAVLVGNRSQAEVNSLVVRSSAGAVNHLPIVQTDDLISLAEQLKSVGVQIVGGSEKGTKDLDQTSFSGRTLIIIGNEGRGIRESLLQQCDQLVKIPQAGEVGSLNAAVSAGILFYELIRQQRSREIERGT